MHENVDALKLTHRIDFSAQVTFLSSRVNTASDDRASGPVGLGVNQDQRAKQGPLFFRAPQCSAWLFQP